MKNKKNYIVYNKLVIFFILFCFLLIIERGIELALFSEIDGINLQAFADNRNTVNEILLPDRGSIYSNNGTELAINVNSYTLIAYLSDTRSTETKIRHVVNKEKTAELLSPILNMSEETIYNLLDREAYQVELGPGGRGLTELEKEEIEALELNGLDFIKTIKRYYPLGDFASYTLGYAKQGEDEILKGELGIEQYYDEKLSGETGSVQYQKDNSGYQIPGTPEIVIDAIDGCDVYLTIDSQIQLFAERAVREAFENYEPDWITLTVADAKTGAILANVSNPSFDPNIKDIEIYENRLVSYPYEPGSTMKIFTYMAVMENETYDGDETFKSGTIEVYDSTIKDWNKNGFGTITYDEGFLYSSNVGVVNLVENYIERDTLKDFYTSLGFGSLTNIELPREVEGKVEFVYPVEVVSAGFGQGILTTPIQTVRALTTISNDGVLLNPYIVSKIVDPLTNEVVYEGQRKEVKKVASTETVEKIKELMYGVVHDDGAYTTGKKYNVEDYDLIGKTGTAQVYDYDNNRYYSNEYIYSFAGMFPYDDPEIIVYISMKDPNTASSTPNSEVIKSVVKDVGIYLNILGESAEKDAEASNLIMDQYVNKSIEELEENVIILGDGDTVVDQFPEYGSNILTDDKKILLTNYENLLMPDISGWSLRDVNNFVNLINLKLEIEGEGYVVSQSILKGEPITIESVLNISLENKEYIE